MSQLFFVLFLLFQSVLGNKFYSPPPPGSDESAVYKLGKNVPIQWETSIERPSLLLCQKNMTDGYYTQCELSEENIPKGTNFNWTATTHKNLRDSNVFRLTLRNEDTHYEFDTKGFNLTEDGIATTLTPSSTPSSTDSPPSAPATPLVTASSNSGLSPQTKVGVGVGVGLGGAFLIALAAIVWYFRRRTKNAGAGGSDDLVDNMSPHKQESIPQQLQQSAPTELPGDRGVEVSAEPAPVRHELP